MTISRSLRLLVVAAAIMAVLPACTQSDPLAVGSCIADPQAASSTTKVSSSSCEVSHFWEIVGIYQATDGPFPGSEALSTEASQSCQQAFQDVVGIAPAQSVYDLFPLTPTEASWTAQNDRSVLCAVRASDGAALSGSVEGTKR